MSPRLQHVVKARYWRGKTLGETAAELGGVSRERARQLEVEALGKLRRTLRAN